jgi:hypothetical protein
MKPSLKELQNSLASVVDGSASPDVIAQVQGWIEVPQKSLSADERTAVYSDGWFMRLEESLAEDFPSLRARFSNSAWESLVRAYLRKYPSSSFTLARAGDAFPLFLAEAANQPKAFADLALFEKAIYKSLNAKDVQPWDVASLQEMDPEAAADLKFELVPSATLIQSSWNIDELQDESEAAVAERETYVLVYREGFTPTSRILERDEFLFLKRASEGATLSEIVDEFPDNVWLSWLVAAASTGTLKPILD